MPATPDRPSGLRDRPAYPLTEAARYARVAPATLRSWVVGRPYPTRQGTRQFRPLIRLADCDRRLLSFNNLVEAHVLRALRTTHGTPIHAIREAIDYAEREFGIERLLLNRQLCTDAGDLLLDRYGQLINLSRSGQLAMRSVLQAHLRRVEWDDTLLPRRLYPFAHGETGEAPRWITIDPAVGFGRPIVESRGISTSAIVDRIDAGESVEDVARDYDLEPREVEEAVVYERAA